MVGPTLTKELIDAGEALVRRLDEDDLSPEVALWLYSEEAEAWTLVLAEATVAAKGRREIYRRIQRVLTTLPDDAKIIHLEDISLMSVDEPLVSSLRATQAFRTGREVSGVRITKNFIEGTLIEDAYIYRVA